MDSTSSVASIIPNTTLNTVTVNKNLNNTDTVAHSKRVEFIADKLVAALNNPNRRAYYCKVAYKLSEGRIWDNLEAASTGREPAKLFTWLCQRDMAV